MTGRLLQSAAVLLAMSFVVYGLMGLMPGDPIDLMIAGDPRLTPEDAVRLKALYGLDRPWVERWMHWLGGFLRGELGYSRLYARPVAETMAPALLNSAVLMLSAMAVSLSLAVPLGIWASLRPGGGVDRLINLLAFASVSVPVFWLGLMLIVVFAVTLGWLPAGGIETVGGGGLSDRLRHMALPVCALALGGIGQPARHMRAAMIAEARADYIRTARAKGCGPARVVLGHQLRNALLPIVTIVALEFGGLFSGALITETVFAWPGMGKLLIDSIYKLDRPVIVAYVMLVTFIFVLVNLLVDLLYAVLDPRVQLQEASA